MNKIIKYKDNGKSRFSCYPLFSSCIGVIILKKYFPFLKLSELLVITLGCAIYGISANIFIIPNHIAPGGATGLSIVINYLTKAPVGVMIILLNIPLFFFSKRMLGKTFLLKTIIATVLFSVFVDIFVFLPSYTNDKLIASLFGGAFGGIGFGLVYSKGIMTGGSDLLARLLKRKLPFISLGEFIFIIDVLVITIATITFKNITSAFYSIIALFISTRVIDAVLTGVDKAKAVLIISTNAKSISKEIINKLSRTATLIDGVGTYTNEQRQVLLCAVRRYELYKLKNIVHFFDKNAFVIVFDVGEVLGLGFKDNRIE